MIRIVTMLTLLGALSSGCVVKTPILLYERQRFENPNKLPIKAGLANPKFEQRRSLCSITTVSLPFPFYILKAGLPKPDEQGALKDAMLQYIRDHNIFTFVYPQPFDKKDVDVILDVRVKEFRLRNNSFWSSFWTIPYLNLLTLIGIPQEHFSCDYEIEIAILLPNAEQILKYQFRREDSDFVTFYERPFTGYIWYESVFRDAFLKLMGDFQKAFETDSAQIVQAVESFRRGG